MPSTLGRNLNLCFTKIRRLPSPPMSPTPDNRSRSLNTDSTATTSTSHLIKNFNSLYDDHILLDSATEADFATAFASNRFFFTSPGRSNSIVDQSTTTTSSSRSTATSSSDPPDHSVFTNSVAVPTYSPDPYLDFRRSMQEMVEARDEQSQDEAELKKSNWDFLHELLLCYLALNPKNTHKFIIGAFSDLVVSLMPSPAAAHGTRKDPEFTAGVCEISRCIKPAINQTESEKLTRKARRLEH